MVEYMRTTVKDNDSSGSAGKLTSDRLDIGGGSGQDR